MKLPKTLYVAIAGDKGGEYFSAAEKAEHLVEMGQTIQIGKYQLVEFAEAMGVAQILPPKPTRRRTRK